jgi:hypothetical protein
MLQNFASCSSAQIVDEENVRVKLTMAISSDKKKIPEKDFQFQTKEKSLRELQM